MHQTQTNSTLGQTPPLWPHQLEALKKFISKKYGLIQHEMGLGKTRTALEIVLAEFTLGWICPRTLILAPVSVVPEWGREVEKSYPQLKEFVCVVSGGSGAEKADAIAEKVRAGVRIIAINYEALLNDEVEKALAEFAPELLFLDEVHRVKNRKAKRTQAVLRLASKARRRFGLTGTIVPNRAEDLWAPMFILSQGDAVSSNFFSFRNKYFYDSSAAEYIFDQASGVYRLIKREVPPWGKIFPRFELKPGSVARELRDKLADMSHVATKSECLKHLPPVIRVRRNVTMFSEVREIYTNIARGLVAYLRSGKVSRREAAHKLITLMQVTCGIVTDSSGTQVELDCDKYKEVEEILEDAPPHEKFIIWTPWVATYERLRKHCERADRKTVVAAGNVTPEKRTPLLNLFRDDSETTVLISNPAALAVGVNLKEASSMIYFSRTYNLEHDLQSEARAHRGDSTHEKIFRIDLVTEGTIEEQVIDCLQAKKDVQDFFCDFANMRGIEWTD